MSSKQLINLNKVQDYHAILLCLHWVGGNGFSYRKLAMSLASYGILVYGFALTESTNPNNGKSRPKSVQEAAECLLQSLEATQGGSNNKQSGINVSSFNPLNKPVYFFGHSYGGIIAYEAVRMLSLKQQQQAPTNYNFKIEKLFVSCVRSPKDLSQYNQAITCPNHALSDAALIKEIVRIGGLPVGVDEQFLWMGLPAIRADFASFESYHQQSHIDHNANAECRLPCPIIKISADCDQFVTSSETNGWENNSYSDNCVSYELQGASHFYLSEERCLHALLDILCHEIGKQ